MARAAVVIILVHSECGAVQLLHVQLAAGVAHRWDFPSLHWDLLFDVGQKNATINLHAAILTIQKPENIPYLD